MKVCPVCNSEKDFSNFYKYFDKKRKKHRISNYCISCGRIKSNERALEDYKKKKEQKKQYSRKYRAKNKAVIREKKRAYKRLYAETLKDCYVREQLYRCGFSNEVTRIIPELIETKRLQIQIKRKLNEKQTNRS